MAAAIDTDSDHDGLKDWEETIFRTDAKNPDTDGDGTYDGEEIAENRNPLKKGPDDAQPIAEKEPDPVYNAYSRLKELSSQGNITQALVYQIINQNGLDSFLKTGNSKETANTLEAYLKKIKSVPEFSEDSIPDNSLVISSETGTPAVKNYFNGVAGIYEKNIFPLKEDDLSILRAALDKNDPAKLNDLSRFIAASERTYEAIAELSAPKNILLFHKKELFLIKSTAEELKLLQSASLEDALYITLLMNIRIERKKQVSALHNTEIPAWFESKKMAFSSGEKAYPMYQRK